MGKKLPVTANPQWFNAKKAEDIIAKPPRSTESDDLMYYVGLMKITQGPMHGKRLSEVTDRFLNSADEMQVLLRKELNTGHGLLTYVLREYNGVSYPYHRAP